MKFEVGDIVSLKSTGEEGTLVSINPKKNIAEVSINNVIIPVHADALEHPYLNWFLTKKFTGKVPVKPNIDNIVPEKQDKKKPHFNYGESGIHLVFVPIYASNNFENESIEKVKIFLVNNTNVAFAFRYNFYNNNGEAFNISSDALPTTNFYVHNVSFENLATGPYFEISGVQDLQQTLENILQFEESFQLKPKKLFQFLHNMRLQNHAVFGIKLLEVNIETVIGKQQKEEIKTVINTNANTVDKEAIKEQVQKLVESQKQPKKQAETKAKNDSNNIKNDNKNLHNIISHFANSYEIDLHLEKLLPNSNDIAHNEKLTIQLDAFIKALEYAIMQQQSHLVVIHGLGKGILKAEIHNILNQTKLVHSYVNEYNPKYGFGSTEIFFEYKP